MQTDPNTKDILEILSEKLKYSNPMSDESLTYLKDEIGATINILKTNPTANIHAMVKQIEMLLLECNKRIKLFREATYNGSIGM